MVLVPLLILLAEPVASLPRTDVRDDAIVVIAASLEQLAEEYRRCDAQPCTVRRDAVVSIRYAEALFRRGDVAEARSVLRRSRSRTRGREQQDPLAAAAILDASATVADHWGDRREEGRARGAAVRLLRAEAPETTQLYAARMRRIAAVQDGSLMEAAGLYRALIAEARDMGRPDVSAAATLRLAANRQAAGEPRQAGRLLQALIAAPDTPTDWVAQAEILALRLEQRPPTASEVTRLLALVGHQQDGANTPILLYAPATGAEGCGSRCAGDAADSVASISVVAGVQALRWVDIRYVIAADGRVSDVTIARSGGGPTGWSAPLLRSIAGRLYLPRTGGEPVVRTERATLTSDFATPTGSLVRRRGGAPRIETLDLTTGG